MSHSILLKIMVALLGLPLFSHSISRVGNGGVKSYTIGYTLHIPREFSHIEFYPNENARLFNVLMPFAPLKSIELRNFSTEFPELHGKSSNEIQSFLFSTDWELINNARFCGKLYFQETETTHAYIAIWGNNKGFVLLSQKTDTSLKYLDAILNSVVIDQEHCQ